MGLGAEDRAHARSSGLEWFKAEKGRTYRVALVYFYPTQFAVIQAARKAGATDADIRQAVDKHLAELAEKLGKARDQLSEVDLLDLGRPRFKRAEVHFVSGPSAPLKRAVPSFFQWPRIRSSRDISFGGSGAWATRSEVRSAVTIPMMTMRDISRASWKWMQRIILPWIVRGRRSGLFVTEE